MLFDLKEFILDKTQYKSGYEKTGDEYVLSASMLGSDVLQNYFTIIYGHSKDIRIGDNTLGTIFHRGMETMIMEGTEKSGILLFPESRYHYDLDDNWVISGTADLIIQNSGEYEIHDYKLSKSYTTKMMKKNITNHQYTKQLNVLNWLMRKRGLEKDAQLIVDFFLKDAKIMDFEESFQQVEVPVYSMERIEGELLERTKTLQSYIESATVPPQCEDLWPRKVKNKLINAKCEYYCGHKSHCPYVQSSAYHSVEMLAL